MCKVISVCNQKGGCGKSNVSVNLAAALVKQGQKVLVVDADPQGSCTICVSNNGSRYPWIWVTASSTHFACTTQLWRNYRGFIKMRVDVIE